MTYNIRYLAIYIESLKICIVRYIFSRKHQNKELFTRKAFKYSFLLSCIDRIAQLWFKITAGGITC